jgi:hypothetical protein
MSSSYFLSVRAAWSGLRDGRQLIPSGPDQAPFVRWVHASFEARAQKLALGFIKQQASQQARLDALRLGALLARQAAGDARAAEATLGCRYESLQQQASQLRLAHPAASGGLPGWAYCLLVVALCFMEWPLVYLSFTTFGLSPFNTALLAGLCSALTGLLGHAVGSFCRHLRISSKPILAVTVLGSLGFVGALAYLRESAMAALASDTAVLNSRAAALALFAISLATLGVAALLAWHQPANPLAREVTAVAREWRRSRREAVRAQSRFLRAGRAEYRVQRRLQALREQACNRVAELGMQALAVMHAYAMANVRARETNDLPEGLRDDSLPRIAVPAVLLERSDKHDAAS